MVIFWNLFDAALIAFSVLLIAKTISITRENEKMESEILESLKESNRELEQHAKRLEKNNEDLRNALEKFRSKVNKPEQ